VKVISTYTKSGSFGVESQIMTSVMFNIQKNLLQSLASGTQCEPWLYNIQQYNEFFLFYQMKYFQKLFLFHLKVHTEYLKPAIVEGFSECLKTVSAGIS
jgi:hypothetical protein